MKFKVNQCIVTAEGVFNCGKIYDSADYTTTLVEDLQAQGIIEDTSYIGGAMSISDLNDVDLECTPEMAGHVLVVNEDGSAVDCTPKTNIGGTDLIELNDELDHIIVGNRQKGLFLRTSDDNVFIECDKTERNPFGADAVALGSLLYKVIFHVPEGAPNAELDGQVVFNGVLGNYITADVHLDEDGYIIDIFYTVTGQVPALTEE